MNWEAVMVNEFYYRKQVVEIFGLEEDFLDELEAEELIRPLELGPDRERAFSTEEVERIRIICNLVKNLEVNLAGVEVILEMRENMIRIQKQFDEILESLIKELKQRLR